MRCPTDISTPSERIGWRWLVALLPLIVLAHEGHELAHTLGGRLICGRWATRDFSVWAIDGCSSWWPTLLGPLFSYLLMAVGAALALRGRHPARWVGLALVFAANPLARVVTAATGRGDELLVARALAGVDGVAPPALYLFNLLVVLGLAGVVIRGAWHGMRGVRRRGPWFAVLLFVAMAVTGPGTGFFNHLLRAGLLDQPVLGAPLLVHVVTGTAVIAALVTARWLCNPSAPPPEAIFVGD